MEMTDELINHLMKIEALRSAWNRILAPLPQMQVKSPCPDQPGLLRRLEVEIGQRE